MPVKGAKILTSLFRTVKQRALLCLVIGMYLGLMYIVLTTNIEEVSPNF